MKTLQKNKYFLISLEKEQSDTERLIEQIKSERWINSSTVLVNCSPDYSSRLVQTVNHRLSHLNRNELFEQVPLEMPYPNMSQVYDPQTHKYEMFDRYLTQWMKTHISKHCTYLFLASATIRGKNFNKIRMCVKPYLEPLDYRFASLYVEKSSIFHPDYSVESFDSNSQGGLLFQWENLDNPNWNY